MHTTTLSLAASVALGAFVAAGCGGSVDQGPGGGGPAGVSSSGVTGSSSGSTGSSSGATSSSSSSGGPTTSPECAGLPVPSIALVCPDGSGAAPYYVWNGSQCVAAYQCPPGSVQPGGPASSSSSSSGGPGTGISSSSSGGALGPPPPSCDFALPDVCEACADGETVCAHYAIQNGTCVAEICPPSTGVGPVGGTCSQGATCAQGTGCATASSSGGCSVSCDCDSTGHYQCTDNCGVIVTPPSPPTNPCSQGQQCSPGSGCGGGPDAYGCFESCTCTSYGTLDCSYDCGFGAEDAGVEDATPGVGM